jgi:hypothetical protein
MSAVKTRELYSIEEARSLLGGIGREQIYGLLNSGELSSVTIGRRRFVPAGAIASFIAVSATNIAPSARRASGRHRAVQMPLEFGAPAPGGRRRIAASR